MAIAVGVGIAIGERGGAPGSDTDADPGATIDTPKDPFIASVMDSPLNPADDPET